MPVLAVQRVSLTDNGFRMSHFFQLPSANGSEIPLEVYLGPVGPLRIRYVAIPGEGNCEPETVRNQVTCTMS